MISFCGINLCTKLEREKENLEGALERERLRSAVLMQEQLEIIKVMHKNHSEKMKKYSKACKEKDKNILKLMDEKKASETKIDDLETVIRRMSVDKTVCKNLITKMLKAGLSSETRNNELQARSADSEIQTFNNQLDILIKSAGQVETLMKVFRNKIYLLEKPLKAHWENDTERLTQRTELKKEIVSKDEEVAEYKRLNPRVKPLSSLNVSEIPFSHKEEFRREDISLSTITNEKENPKITTAKTIVRPIAFNQETALKNASMSNENSSQKLNRVMARADKNVVKD